MISIKHFRHPDKNIHNDTVRKIFTKLYCRDSHNKFSTKRHNMIENNDYVASMLSTIKHPEYSRKKEYLHGQMI